MLTVVEAGRSIWVLVWDMCGSENKKGPPCGEPFLILRMVRHQESNCNLS